MSRIFLRALAAVALLLPSMTMAETSPAPAPAPCMSPLDPIDEQGFVSIGGIEQWVTVKGERCGNPIVLFLHGGPGNPLSPYGDALFGAWAKHFTLVHWDQRGAGMTYGRSTPGADTTLTIARMVEDGFELAAYLAARFGQDKVILWGSSWGSILGVHMAKARPELFHAYLGTAQVVSRRENDASSYARLLALAHADPDPAPLLVLEAVGAPPRTDPRSFGKLRRVIRSYEASLTTAPPQSWWKPTPAYATPKALADHEAGEEYSFLAFVGLNGDGMYSVVDLPGMGTGFDVPMFFVHGRHDLLATVDVAQRYHDSLQAPRKAFVVVDTAGHDPNQAMVDAQYRMLVDRILPLIRD